MHSIFSSAKFIFVHGWSGPEERLRHQYLEGIFFFALPCSSNLSITHMISLLSNNKEEVSPTYCQKKHKDNIFKPVEENSKLGWSHS